MRIRSVTVPAHLRNGDPLPPSFGGILGPPGGSPRYKIVVSSIDSIARYFRLVHSYYIYLIGEDPSWIRGFMRERNCEPVPGFEDGHRIEGLLVFYVHELIPGFSVIRDRMADIEERNRDRYVVVKFHNVVQYSDAAYRDRQTYFSGEY
jgi:hypothetical protein